MIALHITVQSHPALLVLFFDVITLQMPLYCIVCDICQWGWAEWTYARGYMPPGASRGGAERGCGNFFRHEIHKNYVSSVEAGMGMEGQIMCIEQCTF